MRRSAPFKFLLHNIERKLKESNISDLRRVALTRANEARDLVKAANTMKARAEAGQALAEEHKEFEPHEMKQMWVQGALQGLAGESRLPREDVKQKWARLTWLAQVRAEEALKQANLAAAALKAAQGQAEEGWTAPAMPLRNNAEMVREAHKGKTAKKIHRPPGCRLRPILDFFCAPKTMERVFDPLLADMQREYFDALSQDQIWKSRWIRVRYAWAMVRTIGFQSIIGFIKQLIGVLKLQ